MQEVLGMTRRLKADLPALLEEHHQMVGALDQRTRQLGAVRTRRSAGEMIQSV